MFFRGGQGTAAQGDTLEFDSEISNDSQHTEINDGTYVQPVPDAIDVNTLKVAYGDDKKWTALKADDYTITMNQDGTKNINLKHVNISKNKTEKIKLQGTLVNSENAISNHTISFQPHFLDNVNDLIATGSKNTILFTDNSFTFKPHDIDYGTHLVNAGQQLKPVNMKDPLITDIHDNRRDKTALSILVQQNSEKFTNDNNHDFFNAELLYDNNSLINPTVLFETNNDTDLYMQRAHPIILNPKQSLGGEGGEYSTKLTWTINRGIH